MVAKGKGEAKGPLVEEGTKTSGKGKGGRQRLPVSPCTCPPRTPAADPTASAASRAVPHCRPRSRWPPRRRCRPPALLTRLCRLRRMLRCLRRMPPAPIHCPQSPPGLANGCHFAPPVSREGAVPIRRSRRAPRPARWMARAVRPVPRAPVTGLSRGRASGAGPRIGRCSWQCPRRPTNLKEAS